MHGHGGSYEIDKGERVQREAPTQSHPDGDRARPAEAEIPAQPAEPKRKPKAKPEPMPISETNDENDQDAVASGKE